LRRAALGLVQILLAREIDFDLREGIRLAAAHQPIPVSGDVLAQIMEFLAGRLRGVLTERGFRYDIVEAVLGAQAHNPLLARRAAAEITNWVARPDWAPTLAAYARCVRITREIGETFVVDPADFREDAERALWDVCTRLQAGGTSQLRSVDGFLTSFLPHIPVISAFFEKVLVMTDDAPARRNRLGMLQIIAKLPADVADFSKLEGF
jgi:glycyl-tRNA synthetase beta subunit